MKLFMLVILLSMFVAFEGCSKNKSNGEDKTQNSSLQDGQNNKAPDFNLEGVDGKTVKLSDYKGKIIIVDFWATWCPPCRKGIPDLVSIQKEFKDDVVVIGISLDDETKADVKPFMQRMGINYPIAYGNMEVTQLYGGVEAIPTSFVIDRSGKIVDKHVGLVDKSAYVDAIKKL